MGVMRVLRVGLERTAELPGLRHVLETVYERRFRRETPATNLYRGVFRSFAEAEATAPSTRPLGYDHEATAAMYRERTRRVYISDYPVMFWMSKLFGSGSTSVFDLGGHIGIAYYAYQRYIAYPPGLSWTVCDVPAVNASGREWALNHDEPRRLDFTTDPERADGADIMLASGSLQYLDYTLADLLARLPNKPRHILINLLPVHASESYFTVQNMGTAYCPYRITAERELVDSLSAQGYRQVDRWENPDRRCLIPYHRKHSLDRYFGYCFTRES